MMELPAILSDMECTNCQTDVFDPKIETFSIAKWVPETQSNVLVSVLCVPCAEKLLRGLKR